MEPRPLYKIIIIGTSNVGKTAIVQRLVEGTFISDPQPTVGVEFRSYQCQCSGDTVRLNLWDTAGQEKFRSVSKAYFRNALGALLVFSLTDRSSFDSLSSWLADVHSLCAPTVVTLLVGNKSDLSAERAIGDSEARAFGNRHGLDYIETSAYDSTNVSEAFVRLATAIHELRKKGGPAPPPPPFPAEAPARGCC